MLQLTKLLPVLYVIFCSQQNRIDHETSLCRAEESILVLDNEPVTHKHKLYMHTTLLHQPGAETYTWFHYHCPVLPHVSIKTFLLQYAKHYTCSCVTKATILHIGEDKKMRKIISNYQCSFNEHKPNLPLYTGQPVYKQGNTTSAL